MNFNCAVDTTPHAYLSPTYVNRTYDNKMPPAKKLFE